jgi:two-component system sensor histidine kinase YesM
MKKFNSLKAKFIAFYLSVLLAVFLVLLLAIQIGMRVYFKSYIRNNVRGMQEDIDVSVTSVVNEVAFLYARMTKSENVELLNKIANSDKDGASAFSELVNKSGYSPEYFRNIVLLAGENIHSLDDAPLPEEAVISEIRTKKNKLFLGPTLGRQILIGLNMELDMTELSGVLLFYLDGELIHSLCNTPSGGNGQSYIVRADGSAVSPDLDGESLDFRPEEAFRIVSGETGRKIIVTGEMEKLNGQYNFDCFLVSVLDYDAFYGSLNTLERILYAVLLGVFALGAVLAIARARKIALPISTLNQSLHEVIRTGQKSRKIAKPGDEIYQLEKNYDELMETIFELMEKNRREMEMQRKFELYALQMQVNPHFLYNTLDAIAWMAKIKKQPEIEKLVLNLANFFRLSLHKGDKYVTVNHEIELVKAYLEINEIRFPGKVEVSFDLEEGIEEYKILKLLIQPIVENSLKHAFPEGSGKILIRAHADGDDLFFEISDDGVGFDVPSDILASKEEEEILHGYGLYNVNERIRLEYGEGYGLKIQSQKGAGTKVKMKLKKTI